MMTENDPLFDISGIIPEAHVHTVWLIVAFSFAVAIISLTAVICI